MPPPPKPAAPGTAAAELRNLFERLAAANAAPKLAKPKPAMYIETPPGSGKMVYNWEYYYQEPPTLGETYGEKLGLTSRQVIWLDKFYLPENNTFLNVEEALEATMLLYLTGLTELERQAKQYGGTLAKTVKILEDKAHNIAYETGYWYDSDSRGGKAGTDIYLALFRMCENALRAHLNYARKSSKLFPKQIERLEPLFQTRLGKGLSDLLPRLLPLLPPLSYQTEQLFNERSPQRWKEYFASLTQLLPAKVGAFTQAVQELSTQNARNRNRESIYLEAAKALAKVDREAALKMYLHYLHNGKAWVHKQPKTLAKSLEKILFPKPEHAQRFQHLVAMLHLNNDRQTALEKVATVYLVERKKIELDPSAVQTAREQHSGTVELLNEYLQDQPEAKPTPLKPVKKAPAKPKSTVPKTPKASTAKTATAFVSSLVLDPVQQELLHLFATHQLALPQSKVEAFARQHGTLRNQLVDGLNESCYEWLDDVLIEENGEGGYAIYEPYFQKIKA